MAPYGYGRPAALLRRMAERRALITATNTCLTEKEATAYERNEKKKKPLVKKLSARRGANEVTT